MEGRFLPDAMRSTSIRRERHGPYYTHHARGCNAYAHFIWNIQEPTVEPTRNEEGGVRPNMRAIIIFPELEQLGAERYKRQKSKNQGHPHNPPYPPALEEKRAFGNAKWHQHEHRIKVNRLR